MNENEKKIASGIISGVASFLIAEISSKKINELRAQAGLPHLHHYQLGATALSVGALNPDHKLSSAAVGGGIGLMVHDIKDVFTDVSRAYMPLPHPFNKFSMGDEKIQVYKYEVSDTDLKKRYSQIAQILKYWTYKQRNDPEVMAWARKVIRNDPTVKNARSPVQCGRALAYWINGYPNKKPNIKYVRDPRGRSFDSFQTAKRTLKWRTGDCDCLIVLWGTGMQSLGHINGYILLSQDRSKPNIYRHILGAIIDKDGRWIPCELTHKRPIGYIPAHVKKAKILLDD